MNETLRGTWTRFLDRWRAMGPNTRRNIIVITVAVLAALSAILWVVSRPHYVTIMSGLDNKSLGQVENQLQQLKIPSEIQGASVLVPQSQANKARVQLAMNGLPQSGYIGYSSVGGSIGMTQDQFNIQVLDALQQSLNATISSINGIEAAQVHIVMPQSQLFVTQPTSNAKASVFVTVGNGVQLSSAQVAGIQQLVAHAVKGLTVSNVTVVDQNGVTLSGAGGSGGLGAASTEIGERQKLESDMTQQLTTGLQQIVGPGNSVVVVHAQVTFNQVKSTAHTLQNAPNSNQGYVTSQQVTKSQSNSTNGGTGGPAGQAGSNPNLPTYTASGSGASNSTSNQSSTTTNYNYSTTNVQTTNDPIQIQGYNVGIFLNSNDKAITPAEVQQIKSFITSVVGQSGGANNISVSSVPFTKTVATPSLKSSKQNYLLYGILALVGLGLIGGVLVMRRRKRSESEAPREVMARLEDTYESAFAELPPTEDELLRKQLVGMAQQRPDDFASLVRTWISSDS